MVSSNQWRMLKIRIIPDHFYGTEVSLEIKANCFVLKNNTATMTAYLSVEKPPREVIDDVLSWKYFPDITSKPTEFKGATTIAKKYDKIYLTCGESADEDNGGHVIIYYCYDPNVNPPDYFS